jgi:hypothetical protein
VNHKELFTLLILGLITTSPFWVFPERVNAASNNGLVGYWPMNEGTSTQAGDFSGNRNTGTLLGATKPVWGAGKRGSALTFNGSTSYVDAGSSSAYNFTSLTFTVAFWVKSTSLVDSSPFVSRRSSPDGWSVQTGGSVIEFCGGGGVCVDGNTSLSDGKWHHVAVTFSGSNVTFFVDGNSDGTAAVSAPSSLSANLLIGSNAGQAIVLNGSLDDVRIYSRILSVSEIRSLYQSGAGLQKPENNLGLVGYWPMNEGTTTTSGDFSGNGNKGTFSGSSPPTSTSGWTNGKRGGALGFDGTNDCLSVGDISATEGQSKMTISLWLYDRNPAVGKGIVSKYTGATPGWALFTSDVGAGGRDDMEFDSDGGGESVYTTTNAHKANRWEHWVVVYDGTQGTDLGKIDLYLNGAVQSEALVASPVGSVTGSNTNTICIGSDADTTAGMNAIIDEVRIYNRALSVSEIRALYGNNTSGAVRGNASSKTLTNGTTLTRGLSGLWTFDGGDVKWSSSNTGTAFDGSGNGRTLTLTSMSQSTSVSIGKLGQGLFFNGSNSFLISPLDLTSFITSSDAAFALWVKPTGTPAGAQLVVTDDIFEDISIKRDDASTFSFNNWDGAAYDTVTVPYTNNAWTHLVLVHSGGVLYAYKDGTLVGSVASGNTTNLADPLILGASNNSAFFNGSMDDVRIYNRGLSATEAKQLYLLGTAKIRP